MSAGGHNGHDCECGHDHAHAGHGTSATDVLLVNIGNSRIAVAAYSDESRGAARYFAIDKLADVTSEMKRIWDSFSVSGKRAVVVASVNPPCLDEVRRACGQHGIGPLLVIGEDIDLPMSADVDEPEKVGKDRLCAAAGAYAKINGACVVADFGTAVTVDLVADNGLFLGGTIIPGMSLCAQALHEHTALLPLVEISGVRQLIDANKAGTSSRTPSEILGKDTASAIRNGIFAMMIGALREITERYATEIGKWPPLIVTGGNAEVIAPACDFVDRMAPDLVLDGMVIAWQRACESQE